VKSLAASVFGLAVKFGGVGLLVIGILDSSYLFLPWGNDLLVIAMTARHRDLAHTLYYATMSAIGSTLGCLVIDATLRPLGAAGLEKHVPKRRLNSVRGKIEANAGRALAIASLAPPPFPFTVFIMAAAALQYPRRRMVVIVAATRMVRFIVLGLLAMRFGRRILRWADNSVVQGFLIALVVVCVVGSIVSVIGWIRRSRSTPAERPAT
jgi:membrane protein YqaA with SNARE-associated domain